MRYSPNKEEREERRQYRELTEIDYTEQTKSIKYNWAKSEFGKYKITTTEAIKAQREEMLAKPELRFRRYKDHGMIKDIKRHENIERLKKDKLFKWFK